MSKNIEGPWRDDEWETLTDKERDEAMSRLQQRIDRLGAERGIKIIGPEEVSAFLQESFPELTSEQQRKVELAVRNLVRMVRGFLAENRERDKKETGTEMGTWSHPYFDPDDLRDEYE